MLSMFGRKRFISLPRNPIYELKQFDRVLMPFHHHNRIFIWQYTLHYFAAQNLQLEYQLDTYNKVIVHIFMKIFVNIDMKSTSTINCRKLYVHEQENKISILNNYDFMYQKFRFLRFFSVFMQISSSISSIVSDHKKSEKQYFISLMFFFHIYIQTMSIGISILSCLNYWMILHIQEDEEER